LTTSDVNKDLRHKAKDTTGKANAKALKKKFVKTKAKDTTRPRPKLRKISCVQSQCLG